MSAIFGLVNFDGQPLPPESLSAMQAAISPWGPDGCAHWRQDNAGLGHALLIAAPASRHEVMLLHDPVKKQILVAAARLDNRDELCETFGISPPERSTTPDGRLIQFAFNRWGESCPKKLYGDWSMAVWDYNRQRLFLARDQFGSSGLFYFHQPPLFGFASSLKSLLALPEVPRRLSEWHLACYLTVFYEGYGAGTLWQGIEQLLPGFQIIVTSEKFHRDAYWRLEDAPPVRLGSDEDYLAGFLDQYRRAVRCRLDSVRPVGVTLSSGLDSGSVTALAAEAYRSRGKRLTAFTSSPLYPADSQVRKGKLADEWPLAQALAEQYENIDHIPIRAELVSPISSIDQSLKVFPLPVNGFGNIFWILALHAEAQRRGLGVLLNGQLGNASVSWSGGSSQILFQFLQGNWGSGRQSLVAWKQRHGCSWLSVLKTHLLRPVLGPLWRRRHRLAQPFSSPWADYAAIHPAFARRLHLRQAMRAQGHDPSFATTIKPYRERNFLLSTISVMKGPFEQAYGAAFGQELRDPTADVQLLEYCLGLPDEQYTRQGGTRMLLRRGLTGLMPEVVLWNQGKGKQAADLIFRLLHHKNEVTEKLNRFRNLPIAKEYLDLPRIDQTWQMIQVKQNPHTSRLAAGLFMRGIGAGRFLEILEAKC